MTSPLRREAARRGTMHHVNTALGLRLRHLVGTAALEPSAVPDAAVLLVRRLPDPMPRHIGTGAWHAPADWERAARAALVDCYRGAARPGRGIVSASANAVVFEDRCELLACLLRDMMAGRLDDRWWWRVFLRATSGTLPASLPTLLSVEALYLPGALQWLAGSGEATRIVSALAPADAAVVLRAVAIAFELPVLVAPPPPSERYGFSPLAPAYAAESATGAARGTLTNAQQAASAAPPPWAERPLRIALPTSLGFEQASLLGICRSLARAPLLVRSRGFIAAYHTWRGAAMHQALFHARSAHASASTAGEIVDGLPTRAQSAALVVEISAPSEAVRVARDELVVPRLSSGAGAPEDDMTRPWHAIATELPSAVIVEESTSPIVEQDASAHMYVAPREARRSAAQLPHTGAARNPAAADAQPTIATRLLLDHTPAARGDENISTQIDQRSAYAGGTATCIGGALFLVNVLRALRFFDVLDDLGVASVASGWAWIELVARCLIGRQCRELADDPLWRALALLDGRDEDAILSVDFSGAREYRLPDEWCTHTSEDGAIEARVFWRRDRVQLWHGERFPVADVLIPRDDVTSAFAVMSRLRREHAGCTVADARAVRRIARRDQCAPLGFIPSPELQRFLCFILPYVRWRLGAALGCALDDTQALATVMKRRARLFVTRTHVDVRFPLGEARSDVRLAGVDANPGWVPALGRIVTFFFDSGEL